MPDRNEPSPAERAGQDEVNALVARGAYLEAAALATRGGDLRRAIELLERIWRFADAVPLALTLGDLPLAIRLCLDARAAPRAIEIASSIPPSATADLLAASETLAVRGHLLEAATLAERAGALGHAARLHEQAGAFLAAGRLHERLGSLQVAGRLFERQIALADPTGETAVAAEARLLLGRLLGRLGRNREAARALQVAAHHAATARAALTALCGQLLALDLPHAAGDVARRLHAAWPELPEDPSALSRQEETGPGHPATPGTRFSDLRLIDVGAVGRVYAAHDHLLGRTVALKLVPLGADAAASERQAVQRFIREAETTGRLRHPNIVALHDADDAGGLLVLEYLAGGTLASRLQQAGPLAPAAVRRLGLDLLAALAAAHHAGVVHRDVKPANVFFDAAGNAKLADFGAAHLLELGQTQTGAFIGTLAYLSPEQIGGTEVSFATDLYGLGVTLFEALTGQLPFPGPDFIAQHLGAPPPDPRDLANHLTEAHVATLQRALAKAPGDRFASAEVMAEVVASWPTEEIAPTDPVSVMARPPNDESAPASYAPFSAFAEIRELRQTPRGRLVRARDERMGRDVLVEELGVPLTPTDLATLARLAAAGGPHVQRVLAVTDDLRRVMYEAIDDPPVSLDLATPAERALLDPAVAAVPRDPASAPCFARTPTGPVLLVEP